MEGELRLGGQVGQPAAGLESRDPAQVDVVAEPVDGDLDPPRLAGTPACGGDVDRAILDRRGGIDGQRLAYVLPHRPSSPALACAVIDVRRAEPVAGVLLVHMGSSSPSQVTLRCRSAPPRALRCGCPNSPTRWGCLCVISRGRKAPRLSITCLGITPGGSSGPARGPRAGLARSAPLRAAPR